MSTSWTSPEPRRTVTGTAFGRPYERVEPTSPPVRQDVRAGLLTAVVTVLVGAPVGLLWAALAPRVDVVVAGEAVNLADTYSDGFIAVDGYFFAAVTLAGLIGGLLAHALGWRHGPAVVLGLLLGGLTAAYVAMAVGGEVGLEGLREAIAAGGQGRYELNAELKSTSALVGWPVASLIAYLAASFTRGR